MSPFGPKRPILRRNRMSPVGGIAADVDARAQSSRLASLVAEKPPPSAILLMGRLRQTAATKKNPKQSTHLGSWEFVASL